MDKTKVPPVVSVDIKSLRWCGGLSGCIRTSATKANLNLLKQRDTFSSEEDDYDEEEVFDKVTEQINQFLDHAGSQDEEWSDKLASAAGAIFTSTSGSIETLSRDSKTVFNKLTATKFHDVASTAEDIFNVMGKAHWTAAGLLVVAAVIKNIQKLKRVDKECVELLRSLHTVGTSLNRLIHLQHRPPEMESNIDRSKKLISRGAALCLAVMYSSGVSKFFRSAGNESKISTCRRDLDRLQSEMSFQLNIATYSESHEPTGLWPHSHQSSSNNQGGKSEEQGKGDIHNQEQNTGEGRKSPERNPQKEILNSRSLQQRSGGRDEAQFAQFLQRRIRILPTPTGIKDYLEGSTTIVESIYYYFQMSSWHCPQDSHTRRQNIISEPVAAGNFKFLLRNLLHKEKILS